MSWSEEASLDQAKRHVRELEARVARQRGIVREMERRHYTETVALARRVLETMEATLQLARQHVERLTQPRRNKVAAPFDPPRH